METTSCVKSVVMAVQQYRNNPSDANLVNLQRQLDVLISITCKMSALKYFDPRQLLPTECFSALVDLMNDHHINASLAQKTMSLLTNLAHDSAIRETLHSVFHLTSSLASYLLLRGTSPTDQCTVQCVELLQKITYNHKLSYQESYVEDLVRFLVKSIVSKEANMIQPCLGLFANVCRHNFSIQKFSKSLDNMKAVYKTLISYLSHHDMTVVVFSMSILISLCLHEELGEKLFNSKNIHQTFQLIFNIILNGDSGSSQSYAVDLFIDLIKDAKIRSSLVVYDHMQLCVKQVMGMLPTVDGEAAGKLFELLLSFCTVSGLRSDVCRTLLNTLTLGEDGCNKKQLPANQLSEPFFAIIHWADQSVETHDTSALYALEFLKEMYEEMMKLNMAAQLSSVNDLVLPVVKRTLSMSLEVDSVQTKKKWQKVMKALQLLSVICDASESRSPVCESISMTTYVQLLEDQFNHNKLGSKYRYCEGELSDVWSDHGIDVVLHTLDVLLKLKNTLEGAEKKLSSILQDSRIVPFLCQGMTSRSRERVHIVLKMVAVGYSLETFPSLVLGDAIAAFNSHHHTVEEKEMNADVPQPPQKRVSYTTSRIHEKENIPKVKKDTRLGKKLVADTDANVQQLIERMQAGMELKDVRNSEIFDVYEHKLQSLQTKENHLQDLLEAKALALAQADRLISQYRCRRAQSEAEAHKLRSLVQDSEKRCEEYREQLNEMMLERERQQSEIEHYLQENQRLDIIAEEHKELATTFAEQANRLENTQRTLATLKQEHSTMSEMHEMLRRHNETLKQQHDVASQQLAELEEERKTSIRQLKDKETKIHELSRHCQKQEELNKKLESDSSDLESAIDKLRSDLSKTELAKKELSHQVSSLEVVCRQHEADIKEKESNLKTLQIQLDKHAQITALINGLSSGKVPPTQLNL